MKPTLKVAASGTCMLCGARPTLLYEVKDSGRKLYCRKCTMGFMQTTAEERAKWARQAKVRPTRVRK